MCATGKGALPRRRRLWISPRWNRGSFQRGSRRKIMTIVSVRPSRAGTVPWPDDVAARYVAEGYWEGRALAAYPLASADAAPDAVAIVDGELRLTYREMMRWADGAALRLRALGLRP